MAQSSGSFSGSIRNGWQKLIVEWTSSQNAETNKSTITANMYFYSIGAIYIDNRNNTTTIDGESLSYTSSAISQSSGFTKLLGTVTKEIQHDDNGNKTFSMSSVFNIDADLGGTHYYNITAYSGNIELPNIPRASTITVNDANIGSSTTININKKASGFTTNLYWRVQGDSNWTYIDNTSQYSYGWTVPTSLYERIRNSKTIRCEFLARTLSGSTTIGDKTTVATFTATGNPTINSVTIIDTNQDTIDLTDDSSKLVMYHSTAKVSVDVSAQNSASISSVKVNGINATYNSTSGKWELSILNVTTNEFQINATDSREYFDTDTQTVTKINYIPLTINSTIARNEPTDGKVNISINGNYFNDTFGLENNSLVVQYRYAEYGDDISQATWQSLIPTITNNTYTLTTQLSNFDYQKQYEFQVRAYDLLEEQQIIGIPVPKGKPVFNWGEDYFNINGELRINEVALTLYPVGSIYMSVVNTNPSTYFGGTWVAWGSGRVPVGVDTNDTNFNSVEKQGGSPDLQQHTHTARLNNNGNHKHQMHFGGNAGSGTGDTISVANTYWGNDDGSMTEGEHDHGGITVDNAGSGNSGNLQPYITCYMWKRTA